MPITSSAKKALRQSGKRHIRNVKQKNALKALVKAYRKAVVAGKKDEAAKLLPGVYRALDKAAKRRKILKKNTASRLKSRLAKTLAKSS
ncbi:MAG: 30S ribosomal protein S20 [bacterium]|nr:30S ribosomal protein S20 [bacterium]